MVFRFTLSAFTITCERSTVICCTDIGLHAGAVEPGGETWRCQATRPDETRHRSFAVLPLQCRATSHSATRRLWKSLWLCVISDIVCRLPRRLRVTAAAPCAALQAWVSCSLCGQMAQGNSSFTSLQYTTIFARGHFRVKVNSVFM